MWDAYSAGCVLCGVPFWSVHDLFDLASEVAEQGTRVTKALEGVTDTLDLLLQEFRSAGSKCLEEINKSRVY